ncbi:molecular chaperone DnaJ [Gigaspora margarita]|uniref:Molecular chaperone DnaJ n=1 Tax=Gigaspora margarita TaxID=4874 RepID=A0A8H3ZWG6_GIGMA|nr:molecular chaperone DnaJ [Gigaspora margarita]
MPKINYYKVLKLTRNTTIQKIKQAYRKLALLYHPNKNVKKSEKERQQAEQKFIEIREAYDFLLNNHKDIKQKTQRQKTKKKINEKMMSDEFKKMFSRVRKRVENNISSKSSDEEEKNVTTEKKKKSPKKLTKYQKFVQEEHPKLKAEYNNEDIFKMIGGRWRSSPDNPKNV